eukprot:302101-Karenia_brevis.AAC.1
MALSAMPIRTSSRQAARSCLMYRAFLNQTGELEQQAHYYSRPTQRAETLAVIDGPAPAPPRDDLSL